MANVPAIYPAAALIAAAMLHGRNDPPVPGQVLHTAKELLVGLESMGTPVTPPPSSDTLLQQVLDMVTTINGKVDKMTEQQDAINQAVQDETGLLQAVADNQGELGVIKAAVLTLVQQAQAGTPPDVTALQALHDQVASAETNLSSAVSDLASAAGVTVPTPAPAP